MSSDSEDDSNISYDVGNTGISIAGESYADQIDSLSQHFHDLIRQMSATVNKLSEQAHASSSSTHKMVLNDISQADRRIAQLKSLVKQCDELQDEFVKIGLIGEFAKGFHLRISRLEEELDVL